MTAPELEAQVLGILESTLRTAVDRNTSTANTQEWDSLRYVEIVAALEEAAAVEFSPEELVRLNSFQNILDVLQAKTGAAGA